MSAIEIILYTALLLIGFGFIAHGVRLQIKDDSQKKTRVRGIKNKIRHFKQRYIFDQKFRQDVRQAFILGLGFLFLVLYVFISSPWPVGLTMRHMLASPNCASARMAGLAPALKGAPGYYSRHDADGDGIACEPFPH